MYAYATYYEIDFSTGTITTPEDITIKKTYNYGGEILGFIVRVTITLIIEIGFFFLTHLFTKHNFKVVVITNVITQLLLNIKNSITDMQDFCIKRDETLIESSENITKDIVNGINILREDLT